MAHNSSVAGGESLQVQLNEKVIVVQILVLFFLCINFFLVVIFFSKEVFYTTLRYILFAVALLSDSLLLIMADILLIMSYFHFTMKVAVCMILYVVLVLYTFVTPVTLTAMTLERYVAICMPLRHAELCSTRRALQFIPIIHGLSSVPGIVVLSAFFASASKSLYVQYKICSMDIFVFLRWQDHVKFAVFQCYFLIMSVTIVFSYVKIVKVAKMASGEDKKSTWKGLRTVMLHAFQLLLCLIQLLCPFIEAAVLKIDLTLYIRVRYFNYIIFNLAPRCMSPLIYGLRDEKMLHALKCFPLCGLYKKKSDFF